MCYRVHNLLNSNDSLIRREILFRKYLLMDKALFSITKEVLCALDNGRGQEVDINSLD
jgi:hypothetical protein